MVVPHPIIAGCKTLLRVPISLSGHTQADDTLSYSGVGAVRNVGLHLHGGVVQSHRPEFLWPHVRTSLSTPPPLYMGVCCKSNPPQEPTPLRFAVRLRIPKPMLPSPALG